MKNRPVKPYIISKGYKRRKRRQLKVIFFIIVSIVLPILLYSPTKDYVNEILKKREEIAKKREEDRRRNMALTIMGDTKNTVRDTMALLEKKASTAGPNMRSKLDTMEKNLKVLEGSLLEVQESIDGKNYNNAINKARSIKEKVSETSNIVQRLPIDVWGEWQGQWEMEGLFNPLSTNKANFKLSLEQNDSVLIGTYYERGGSTKANGRIEGKQLSFEYKYSDGGGRKYTGTINDVGTEVSGKWHQEGGSGSWKMVKK